MLGGSGEVVLGWVGDELGGEEGGSEVGAGLGESEEGETEWMV